MRKLTHRNPRRLRLVTGAWVEWPEIRRKEFLSEEAISERCIDFLPVSADGSAVTETEVKYDQASDSET
jgi:hypothetical protein